MKSIDIFNHIENIEIQISNHKDEIENRSEIGDGDHIFNIYED